MRVIQVFTFLSRDGAESRMMDLYRYIDREKIQFDFIKMNDQKNDFDEEILSLGGRIFAITHPRTSIIKHIRDMYRVFKDEGPFIAAHSHTSYHSAIVLVVAFIAGIEKRVCHARTTSTPHNRTFLLSVTIFLSRIVINLFSTSRLAISSEAAKFLYGKNSIGKRKIEIVPNAINLDDFNRVKNIEKESIRLKFGIKTDQIVMGHVGRFSIMKNHLFLLKLVESMKENMPDICLVCAGDGELRGSIEKSTLDLGIESHVKLLGMRKDIPYVLRCFDVFIFPSFWEGLGGAIIEAQAAGISCVVSDTIPRETDMGLDMVEYVSLNDEKKWIEAIMHAIKKKHPEFETIKQAFELKGFTLDNSCKSIIKAYGMVLSNYR